MTLRLWFFILNSNSKRNKLALLVGINMSNEKSMFSSNILMKTCRCTAWYRRILNSWLRPVSIQQFRASPPYCNGWVPEPTIGETPNPMGACLGSWSCYVLLVARWTTLVSCCKRSKAPLKRGKYRQRPPLSMIFARVPQTAVGIKHHKLSQNSRRNTATLVISDDSGPCSFSMVGVVFVPMALNHKPWSLTPNLTGIFGHSLDTYWPNCFHCLLGKTNLSSNHSEILREIPWIPIPMTDPWEDCIFTYMEIYKNQLFM